MTRVRALARIAFTAPFILVAACSNSVPAPVQSALSQIALMPIGGGNALTLPAQRHMVRIGTTLLLSIQQDWAGQEGLGMFRSDDDGATFQYLGPIQGDASHRDTTDMIVVGQDIALIYSYEGPDLVGSTAHDVYFQWWRHRNNSWSPDPAVRVFDSTSNATGFYRGELAIDGQGRYWIQSFFLETDGSATGAIAVSTNQGASWTREPNLVNLPYRGGGRLTALGTRMIFIYDGHDDGTNNAHFRVRDDSAALGTWGPEQNFNDMVYHGAAYSAIADDLDDMHFVYKDKNAVLWYRYFNGTSFGTKQQMESMGD